jgi:hypothetical protein
MALAIILQHEMNLNENHKNDQLKNRVLIPVWFLGLEISKGGSPMTLAILFSVWFSNQRRGQLSLVESLDSRVLALVVINSLNTIKSRLCWFCSSCVTHMYIGRIRVNEARRVAHLNSLSAAELERDPQAAGAADQYRQLGFPGNWGLH